MENIPLHMWEITVETENGDWHWRRTDTRVTFDKAVEEAIRFEFLLKGGRILSIQKVSEPSYTPREAYYHSYKKVMDRIHTFVEIQQGVNLLTQDEINSLAEKFPERWGMFRR